MSTPRMQKAEDVSDEMFAEIEESLQDALEHARGKRADLRTTRIAVPPAPRHMSGRQIAALREHLNCSQSLFARILNVSVKSVQGWEQGLREPSDAVLKLLSIAEKHPEVLMES